MTTPQDREDEQWLDALAGRPDPSAEPGLNQQAAAVRRALAAQKAEIARQTPKADEVLYQQLLFRLRREGLVSTAKKNSNTWNRGTWAVAASIFAVVIVGFQVPYEDDESWDKHSLMQRITRGESAPRVRGSSNETVILVTDPRQRLGELVRALSHAGVRFEVKESKSGDIRIRIESTLPAFDYLSEQGIFAPQAAAGWIYLRISPNY